MSVKKWPKGSDVKERCNSLMSCMQLLSKEMSLSFFSSSSLTSSEDDCLKGIVNQGHPLFSSNTSFLCWNLFASERSLTLFYSNPFQSILTFFLVHSSREHLNQRYILCNFVYVCESWVSNDSGEAREKERERKRESRLNNHLKLQSVQSSFWIDWQRLGYLFWLPWSEEGGWCWCRSTH